MDSALTSPLEVQTLADQAFDKIMDAIVRGELPPGTKISEALLARQLGISRGPLREAIRQLEGRKLVTRVPRVGTSVVQLTSEELMDILRVREALEGIACRLAAERMSDAELEELGRVLEQHSAHSELKAGESYFQRSGDYDFHYRIARGSKNKKLVELLCGELYYLLRIYRYRSSVAPGRARQAFDEHCQILDAMRGRDGARAEALMRGHICAVIGILHGTAWSDSREG